MYEVGLTKFASPHQALKIMVSLPLRLNYVAYNFISLFTQLLFTILLNILF